MDFAAQAASQKTKATPEFGTSANLTAPVEAAPGVFAKQLIGALKMTKASDLGRPSAQAEAVREARNAHEARQARHDERNKAGRPAKAERPERPERPDRAEDARFERKANDRTDEPRETKAPEKTERPAKPQRAERSRTKEDDNAAASADAKTVETADETSQAAETGDVVETGEATETQATTEAAATDAPAESTDAALLANPFQIALKAAQEAPGPIAVTLLQAAKGEAEDDGALSLDVNGQAKGQTGAEDPVLALQGLVAANSARNAEDNAGDAAASYGPAKPAHGLLVAQQHAAENAAVVSAAAKGQGNAADAFEKILAAKVDAQVATGAAAKSAADALGFANQMQAQQGEIQKPLEAQPIATTQQVQTAQSQTGAKLDQPLMARSTAYLPPSEQVAVQIQRAAEQGASRISIELDPAELGRVEVRLDVDRNGMVAASVVAERPETLDLLKKDQRSLETALQNAGLSTDSANLSFSLREGNKGGQEAHDGNGRRRDRDDGEREAQPVVAEALGRIRRINLDRALDIVA